MSVLLLLVCIVCSLHTDGILHLVTQHTQNLHRISMQYGFWLCLCLVCPQQNIDCFLLG